VRESVEGQFVSRSIPGDYGSAEVYEEKRPLTDSSFCTGVPKLSILTAVQTCPSALQIEQPRKTEFGQ